jgi:hypothetical protein
MGRRPSNLNFPLMPRAWRRAFVRRLLDLGEPVRPAIRHSWLYGCYPTDVTLDPITQANKTHCMMTPIDHRAGDRFH